MNMKEYVKRKTVHLRHRLVKLLAPTLYQKCIYEQGMGSTPRPMITFIKKQKRKQLVGCEIGVNAGENALSILKELKIKKLYLIDPYQKYIQKNAILDPTSTEKESLHRLSRFQNVEFIKQPSDKATKSIIEPLDFVYIDGNHAYKYVTNDILNYYPLVKQFGFIGGHDYTTYYPEVMQAVTDYVVSNRLLDHFHDLYPDWLIVKSD